MQFKPTSPRAIALLTGFALASTAFGVAPAHAMDKSKKLKYGGIAAGVVGAYMLSKGKIAPAAVLGGAGYYAYKKSGKVADEERYRNDRNRYGRDRYGYNSGPSYGSGNSNSGDVYPDDYSSSYRGNAAIRPSQRRGSSNYDLSPYRR